MQKIYKFLKIDIDFKASMLYKRINVARVPKNTDVDKSMHHFSEFLRKNGLDNFVHLVRKTGLPDLIRNINTKKDKKENILSQKERIIYAEFFKEDTKELSKILDRDLNIEWRI